MNSRDIFTSSFGLARSDAAGQPLQVEIGLELAVELLRGGVVPVQGDHLLGFHVQVGPPAFQGNVRGEQKLAMPVGGPFGHAHDPLAGVHRTIDLHGLVDHQQADPLAGPGRGDRAFTEHAVAPSQLVAVARVPLDEEAHLVRRGEHLPGFLRIVGRVQADQDLLLDEHVRRLDDPLDEHHKPRLPVLAAGSQFDLQAPAVHAQVGGDGRINRQSFFQPTSGLQRRCCQTPLPGSLHSQLTITTVSSFQLTRSAGLCLAHPKLEPII